MHYAQNNDLSNLFQLLDSRVDAKLVSAELVAYLMEKDPEKFTDLCDKIEGHSKSMPTALKLNSGSKNPIPKDKQMRQEKEP